MGRLTEMIHFLNSDIGSAEAKDRYSSFSPSKKDMEARTAFKRAKIPEKPKPVKIDKNDDKAQLSLF